MERRSSLVIPTWYKDIVPKPCILASFEVYRTGYRMYYNLPGETLRPHESPIKGAVRAAHEELGLQIEQNDLEFLTVYRETAKPNYIYLLTGQPKGELTINEFSPQIELYGIAPIGIDSTEVDFSGAYNDLPLVLRTKFLNDFLGWIQDKGTDNPKLKLPNSGREVDLAQAALEVKIPEGYFRQGVCVPRVSQRVFSWDEQRLGWGINGKWANRWFAA